ncbi:MAG: TetR/AcrR family transcriptional regulator [Candidatus Brocadiae bacterium]|nr:TetR/AcrR family transcriptional regulator [Candidatus Brocadiia bacterium]
MKESSRDERATRKRLDIARAAAAVFRRKGYAAATTEDIAGAVGMTKGSLYYYFRDKQEIAFFCQSWALDRMIADAERIRKSGAAAVQRLRLLIKTQMQTMLDALHGTAAHIQMDAFEPAKWRKLVDKRDRYEAEMRRTIADGVRKMEFRPVDTAVATRAILGAVNWSITWFRPDGPMKPEDLADSFSEIFVNGLRAKK